MIPELENLDGLFVQARAQAVSLVQRFRDVVDHLRLGVAEEWRAAIPDRLDDLRIHAALEREPLVRVPFVMRTPVPRGDEDGDLRQLRREYRVEAQDRAEPGGMSGHFRAVEPGHHRRRGRAAFSRDCLVVGFLLVGAHFAWRKQLQPHLEVPRVVPLLVLRIYGIGQLRHIPWLHATARPY